LDACGFELHKEVTSPSYYYFKDFFTTLLYMNSSLLWNLVIIVFWDIFGIFGEVRNVWLFNILTPFKPEGGATNLYLLVVGQ
jgi:hypothetical protein